VSFFDAIALGIVQGLTEFLPVSSSGHLVIGQTFLDVPTAGIVLEVALHVATLVSVVIVYRRRLLALALGALRREREAVEYIALVGVATLPAVVVGLFFHDAVRATFDVPAVTGVMLLVTGGILWSTRYVPRRPLRDRPNWTLALVIGCAQAVAILPGISRSGSTITAALWGRMPGDRAAEFSFLMSIPAIAGAAILELRDVSAVTHGGAAPLLAGFVAALISGVAAILGLVWLVRRQAFYAFSYYVWAMGLFFLSYLVLR